MLRGSSRSTPFLRPSSSGSCWWAHALFGGRSPRTSSEGSGGGWWLFSCEGASRLEGRDSGRPGRSWSNHLWGSMWCQCIRPSQTAQGLVPLTAPFRSILCLGRCRHAPIRAPGNTLWGDQGSGLVRWGWDHTQPVATTLLCCCHHMWGEQPRDPAPCWVVLGAGGRSDPVEGVGTKRSNARGRVRVSSGGVVQGGRGACGGVLETAPHPLRPWRTRQLHAQRQWGAGQ